MSESKRITADFSPEAYEVLTTISVRLGTTKAEAIRNALGVLDFILRQQAEGWMVVLEHHKNKERKLITLFHQQK